MQLNLPFELLMYSRQQKVNLANMTKGLYLVQVIDSKGSTLKYTKLSIE
jgi:hypothetical protein